METRLKQIRKELGLRQEQLAEIFDCSKENISMIETGKSSLSERNRKCLVKKFNLNPLWLDGENVPMMLPGFESALRVRESLAFAPANIPFYDIDRAPSLAELFARTGIDKRPQNIRRGKTGPLTREEKMYAPTSWLSIPTLSDCDGAVMIRGDGMNPLRRGGDIIVYKQLESVEDVFWGEEYLLEIETPSGNYVAVRYVRRSRKTDRVVIAGENPQFGDTEIELSKIRAIAFVKASIHTNSSK